MTLGPLSTSTIATVSLICKAFLNSPFCSITVNGLPTLLDALRSEHRKAGQGIVTVCNHISTLDDPLTWGALPARLYFTSQTTRWALGASDVMFTNPLFSTFFRHGQVLETFRGKGIYQPAVDTAIEKLDQGQWVHIFGEGKVNQRRAFEHGYDVLPRFKWGVGRILMETAVTPVVIPMWLTGFEKLMPENRSFPWKYFPRLGVKLSVTFGDPLSPRDIQAALRPAQQQCNPALSLSHNITSQKTRSADELGEVKLLGVNHAEKLNERETVGMALAEELTKQKIDRDRSTVTAVVQRAVEAVGRKVLADALRENVNV